MISQHQLELLRAGICAILETVQEVGTAPAGPMFAAMQAKGCSLNQFQSIMRNLVGAGYLTQQAHTYQITTKGTEFLRGEK